MELVKETVPTVSGTFKLTGLAPVPKIAVAWAPDGGGVPEMAPQLSASDQMPVLWPSVQDAEGTWMTVKMTLLPLIVT